MSEGAGPEPMATEGDRLQHDPGAEAQFVRGITDAKDPIVLQDAMLVGHFGRLELSSVAADNAARACRAAP